MAVLTEYTSGAADGSGYNVKVVFEGSNWSADLQSAFVKAAETLSTIITGDLTDVTRDFGDGQGVRTIDDIEITANLSTMDGSGGVLGSAGPDYYRTGDPMPVTASMNFDIADAGDLYADEMANDTGEWSTVVLHEMLHGLGFGTMWQLQFLIDNNGTLSKPDYRFTGENAQHEYQYLFPDEYAADPNRDMGVPVESDTGNAGTDGGHWDETVFGDEMMTGFLDSNAELSNLTIAALEDMGYQTTYVATASPSPEPDIVPKEGVPCFTPGALISTPRGKVEVQNLRRSDLVFTKTRGVQPLNQVALTRLSLADLEANPKWAPIQIQANALGAGYPSRTLILSPQHRVVCNNSVAARMTNADEVLIPAKSLLALPGVKRLFPAEGIVYLHLKFTQHEVLLAEEMPVESFKGSRAACLPIVEGAKARNLVQRSLKNDHDLYAITLSEEIADSA